MTKEETVKWLITNCSCWQGEGDEAILNNLPDEKLEHLAKESYANHIRNSIAEQAVHGFTFNNHNYYYDVTEGNFVVNKCGGGMTAHDVPPSGEMPMMEEEEEEEEAPPFKGPPQQNSEHTVTTNSKDGLMRPRNLQEFEAWMPDEAKAIWNRAKGIEQQHKEALVGNLVANVTNNEERGKLFTELMKKPTHDLEQMLRLLPKPQVPTSRMQPSYFGNGGGGVFNSKTSYDEEPLPVLNMADLDAAFKK